MSEYLDRAVHEDLEGVRQNPPDSSVVYAPAQPPSHPW
jgi:hypothetical protein